MDHKLQASDVKPAPGKFAEVYFGVTEEIRSPRAVRIADATTNVHFGGTISLFMHTNCWDSGLMFVEPGRDTAVFSIEETDDGTADEWYGPTQELYYIVAGEFTISYEVDPARLDAIAAQHELVLVAAGRGRLVGDVAPTVREPVGGSRTPSIHAGARARSSIPAPRASWSPS